MSKRSVWAAWATVAVLGAALGAAVPAAVSAAGLDGTAPMICAVMAVTECDRWGVCEPADAGSARLPPFLRINVGQKTLEATDGSGRKTAIHSSTLDKDKGRLILQGGEQGRSWSAVIGQQGEMTAAIVDHDGSFLVSGACTLP